MARALATVMKRTAADFSSLSSRSPAPIFPAAVIRCYSISRLTRFKLYLSEWNNHFQDRGRDRMRWWRPFGLLLPYTVQQGTVAVTERFGKFRKILYPGKHWLPPVIDKVYSIHATDELDIPVRHFWSMTKDKANVSISGILFFKVVEPMLASYKVAAPICATLKHAQHKAIAAMAKITLCEFLTGRDTFTENLLASINAASTAWGIECTRFEINDLSFPVVSPYFDPGFYHDITSRSD